MNLVVKPAFRRDRNKITNVPLLDELANKLEQIENATSPENITGLKLLEGYSTHCRIYVKTERQSYRIGAIIRGNTIWLVRFLPRKKIYQQFP